MRFEDSGLECARSGSSLLLGLYYSKSYRGVLKMRPPWPRDEKGF